LKEIAIGVNASGKGGLEDDEIKRGRGGGSDYDQPSGGKIFLTVKKNERGGCFRAGFDLDLLREKGKGPKRSRAAGKKKPGATANLLRGEGEKYSRF